MNSVGIDTFLNTTQTTSQPKAAAPFSDNSDGFKDYLRAAAKTRQSSSAETEPAKAKPAEDALSPRGKGQDTADSSDERKSRNVEAAEVGKATLEEQTNDTVVDELLLSAAAIAAEVVDVPLEPQPEVNLTTAPTISEPTLAQSSEQTAPTQDFLPALEDATTVLNSQTTEALTGSSFEMPQVLNVLENDAQSEGEQVATTVVEQSSVAVTHTTAVKQAATNVDPDAEMDQPEANNQKPVRIEAIIGTATEQLAADVVAAALETDTLADTASAPADESAAPTPHLHSASHNQQQSQGLEAGQANVQAPQADAESHMSTIDRTRFVQRVANAFRSAQNSDGPIQMRLSPPELGSLRIEIAVRNGVLSANLETETADARRVLLDNLPALRQRLAEQEIRIEKFEVDIRREGGHSDGQAGAQDRQAQQQSQRAAAQNRIRTQTTPEIITARVPRQQSNTTDASLDVRI